MAWVFHAVEDADGGGAVQSGLGWLSGRLRGVGVCVLWGLVGGGRVGMGLGYGCMDVKVVESCDEIQGSHIEISLGMEEG